MNDKTEQVLTDALIDQIESAAKASFLRHRGSIKGQILTAADYYDWHLMHAAYKAGHAAAKAEIADVGEPVAWCIPNDPCNATAFAWPGADRTPQHNVPLFTADQLAAAVAKERER